MSFFVHYPTGSLSIYSLIMPLSPYVFFNWNLSRTVIDLRPADAFRKGHFPGAISFPADKFPSAEIMLQTLQSMDHPAPVHLLDQKGTIVGVFPRNSKMDFLQGGYTAYKIWMSDTFSAGPSIGIIGGKTGSGKTELLEQLISMGRQVLHLEKLACHKGSVFGDMNIAQPSPEEFEYSLLKTWLSFDKSFPVWIEEKNAVLGKLFIPSILYAKMCNAVSFYIEQSFDTRLFHLLEEYITTDKQKFAASIRKLEKRMGFSANHKALYYCKTDQMEKCLQLLLRYYDAVYEHHRTKNNHKLQMAVNPEFFGEYSKVLQLEKIINESSQC